MLGNKRLGIARAATTAGLAVALVLGGMPLRAVTALADDTAGNLTINKTQQQKGDVTYVVYQLFKGDVTTADDGGETLSNITWGTGVENVFKAAADDYAKAGNDAYKGGSAQDAADYIAASLEGSNATTIVGSSSLAQLLAWGLANAGLEPTATINAGEAASLADGYYLVVANDDSLGNGAAGTSPIYTLAGGKDVTITEKVTPPTVDKEVQEDSTGDWGHYADANYDQEVSYRLTATLPSNLASFDTYHLEFIDYLSKGLTYNDDSAQVVVVHQDGSEEDVTSSFSVSYPSDGDEVQAGVYDRQSVLTVNCKDIKALKLTSGLSSTDKVVVRYKAHLDDDSALGIEGNPNKVKLVYSNNPNVSGDGETDFVDPVVYTYQLSLHKRDKDAGVDVGLAGAKFTIQLTEGDGAADSASKSLYLQADGSLAKDAHEFETDSSGNIQVARIDAGTYVLRETHAPTGYSLTADTTVKITSTMPKDKDGTLQLAAVVSGNADASLTSDPDADTGTVAVTIKDVKNVGMPQTGSAGFVALMAGGGSMVVLSLAVILRRTKDRGAQR